MLPLAHIGHYLVWALYALPVLAVIAGIVYSTYTGKRARRDDRSTQASDQEGVGRDPSSRRERTARSSSAEDAPPGG